MPSSEVKAVEKSAFFLRAPQLVAAGFPWGSRSPGGGLWWTDMEWTPLRAWAKRVSPKDM